MVIALGHRKRVGKDTVARIIEEKLAVKTTARRYSVAYPLKEVAGWLYWWAGVKHPNYYEQNPEAKNDFLPELGMTYRELLMRLGAEAIRDVVYRDTWARLLVEQIMAAPAAEIKIITDLRFPSEVDALRKFTGESVHVVRVDRPSIPNTNDVADAALAKFVGWDYYINNDGDLDDLREKVDLMLHRLM